MILMRDDVKWLNMAWQYQGDRCERHFSCDLFRLVNVRNELISTCKSTSMQSCTPQHVFVAWCPSSFPWPVVMKSIHLRLNGRLPNHAYCMYSCRWCGQNFTFMQTRPPSAPQIPHPACSLYPGMRSICSSSVRVASSCSISYSSSSGSVSVSVSASAMAWM